MEAEWGGHCSGTWNNRRPLASTSGQLKPLTKDTELTHNELLRWEGRLQRVQFPTQLAVFSSFKCQEDGVQRVPLCGALLTASVLQPERQKEKDRRWQKTGGIGRTVQRPKQCDCVEEKEERIRVNDCERQRVETKVQGKQEGQRMSPLVVAPLGSQGPSEGQCCYQWSVTFVLYPICHSPKENTLIIKCRSCISYTMHSSKENRKCQSNAPEPIQG